MARLRRKAAQASSSSSSSSGSFLWTWLLCGLFATIVNIFYEAGTILHRLHLSRFDPVHGELILTPDAGADASYSSSAHQQQPQQVGDEASSSSVVVDWDNLDPDLVADKGPLLALVKDAGITDVTVAALRRLPSWSDVTDMYGSEPVLWGVPEQCHAFQALPNASMHFVSTAGTFNTGTNLMSELLIANCHLPLHEKTFKGGAGVRWQVQWGKHTPIDNETVRLTHRTYKDPNYQAQHTLPAVMVRDPYKWMQSMCRHRYAAKWKKDATDPSHCPNLVRPDGNTVKVEIEYSALAREHESLVHLWNEWYHAYFKADFPRILVRFEDLVYHPRKVVQSVCECAGGQLRSKFQYIVDSAKRGDQAHGDKSQRTSYLDALIRYGTKQGRYKGFHADDLDFVSMYLDPTMMKELKYPFHQDSNRDAGT